MILRSLALRHGRMASAVRSSRPHVRSVTTERIDSSIESRINQSASLGANPDPTATTVHTLRTAAAKAEADAKEVVENFTTLKHIERRTGSLGSILKSNYEPYKQVKRPLSHQEVSLELLMASQAHIGHATALWNPGNQRYIYGIRQGVHIFSLEVIAAHLRRAAKVVEGVSYHAGLILFVGTRPGQHRAVVKAAELTQGCHLFQYWTPGTLTNADRLMRSSQMKIVDRFDNEINLDPFFKDKLASHRSLKPDLVVLMNPLENRVLMHECNLNSIPTIGVIDTDADPTWVTYPIPANDDSLRAINLICGVLGRAGESGKKKRLEAAKSGHQTWQQDDAVDEWAREYKEIQDQGLSK